MLWNPKAAIQTWTDSGPQLWLLTHKPPPIEPLNNGKGLRLYSRCRQKCWVTITTSQPVNLSRPHITLLGHNLKVAFWKGKSPESRSVNNYNLARSWVMCNHLRILPNLYRSLKNTNQLGRLRDVKWASGTLKSSPWWPSWKVKLDMLRESVGVYLGDIWILDP